MADEKEKVTTEEIEEKSPVNNGPVSLTDRFKEWSENLYFRIAVISLLYIIFGLTVVASVKGKISKLTTSTIDDTIMAETSLRASETYSTLMDLKSESQPLVSIINSGGAVSEKQMIEALASTTRIETASAVDKSGSGINAKGASVSYDISEITDNLGNGGHFMSDGEKIMFVRPYLANSNQRFLVAEFDKAAFDDVLSRNLRSGGTAKTDWVVIMGKDGMIYYSYSSEKTGYLEDASNFLDLVSENAGYDVASSIGGDLQRNYSKQRTFNFDGDLRRVYYTPFGIEDWYLVTGVDYSTITRKQEDRVKLADTLVLWMTLGIAMFVAGIVWVVIVEKNKGSIRNKGLTKLAETDQLTGLFNKVSTENKIKDYMDRHADQQGMLFILDIDNFKKINDTMGHAFGDEVLREIGQRIKMEFRASDIIGRAGGDEFIIFLRNLPTDELIQKEAKKVLNVFKDFQVGTYSKYTVTASIGCAVFPRDGGEWESLYKAADQGLYKAKRGGKNQLVFYREAEEEKDAEETAEKTDENADKKDE